MKKSSSKFVNEADQKVMVVGLWAARNSKSFWSLVLKTDGAFSHLQNTEQNPTQRL